MQLYPANKACPCGTSKTYSKCCKRKGIIYKVDDDGEIIREQKLPQEALDILEKQRQRFVSVFGREPEKDEPLFFDLQVITEKEYFDSMDEMLSMAGINEPALQFAYRKTGFVVSEFNKDFIPDKDLKQWYNAIDEYYNPKKKRRTKFQKSIDNIVKQYENILIFQAIILNKYLKNNQVTDLITNFDDIDFIFFCLTKNIKTLKAFLTLLDKELYEDAFVLTRSMYESYLSI